MLSSTEVHTVLWLEVASGMKEEECTLSEDKGDIFDEGVGALKGGGGSLNEGVGALKGGGGNLDSFSMFARCLLPTMCCGTLVTPICQVIPQIRQDRSTLELFFTETPTPSSSSTWASLARSLLSSFPRDGMSCSIDISF